MAAQPTCATSSVSSAFDGASSPCGVSTSASGGMGVHALERVAKGVDACKIEGTVAGVSEGSAVHASGGTLAGAMPVASVVRQRLATFRSLYSSRDGALCVYEDEDGHLIAVDASKFV